MFVRDCLPDLISCRVHLGLCLLSLCASMYSYVFLSFPLVFDIKGEEMMGFDNAAVKCQRTNLKREQDVKYDCVRPWWSPVYRRCNFSRFTGDLRHRYNYDTEWLFQSILGCAPLNQSPGCASAQWVINLFQVKRSCHVEQFATVRFGHVIYRQTFLPRDTIHSAVLAVVMSVRPSVSPSLPVLYRYPNG